MITKFRLLKVGHCLHPGCLAFKKGSLKNIEFPALVGLLHHSTKGWILFDTGYAPFFFRATQKFPEKLYRMVTPVVLNNVETLTCQLCQLGIQEDDISTIIISHFHADHIAGLRHFSKARFFCSEIEFLSMMTLNNRFLKLRHAFLPQLLPPDFLKRIFFVESSPCIDIENNFHPLKKGYDLFGDQSAIAIFLPGHTHGQIGLIFRDLARGRHIFFVADACWHTDMLNTLQTSFFSSLIFDNKKAYHRTLEKLRIFASRNPDCLIIPSHCQKTWERYKYDCK